MPEDQIRDVSFDSDVITLFSLIIRLMGKRNFCPIEGEADKPDDWKVVIDDNNSRLATNLDISISEILGIYLDQVNYFYGRPDNPIDKVRSLIRMDESDYRDRVMITDDERKAIKRLKQARDEWKTK